MYYRTAQFFTKIQECVYYIFIQNAKKNVFTNAIKPQFDFGLFFAAVINLPFATSKNGRESCVMLIVKGLLFYL